jgi:hypothetical protein
MLECQLPQSSLSRSQFPLIRLGICDITNLYSEEVSSRKAKVVMDIQRPDGAIAGKLESRKLHKADQIACLTARSVSARGRSVSIP